MRFLAVGALAVATLAAPASVDSARAPAMLTFAVDAGRPSAPHGGLCLVRVGGAPAVRLTGPHDDRSPAWSPDGKHVTFSRYSGRRRAIADILLADARGRIVRNLSRSSPSEVFNSEPAWAPSGREIAFSRSFHWSSLFVVRPSGRGTRILRPATQRESYASPTWSPDGKRLAFVATGHADDPPRPGTILTTDRRARRLRRVVDRAHSPAWSPRGGSIAYVAAGVGGARDLYLVNADGASIRPVTRTPEAEAHPAWSPDGRRLAFERDEPGSGGAIVVANADGSNERVAVRSDRYRPAEPAWRPAVALPRTTRPACG